MPILSDLGQRISLWLHEVIYSMPSPDNRTLAASMASYDDDGNSHTKLSDLIEEPGEPKALAGGIGPLSFAGSGYGVMLVLTVGLVDVGLEWSDERLISVGYLAKSHTPYSTQTSSTETTLTASPTSNHVLPS